MDSVQIPTLRGSNIFRPDELVYINRSDEYLEEYMRIMHRHDFIEIFYVYSGKGIHIVGDHKYNISKGDLFIVNYDVPHGFARSEETDDEKLVVYNCAFKPEFIDSSLFSGSNFEVITSSFLFKSLFAEEGELKADLQLKGADFLEIGELFTKMLREYTDQRKGYCDIIRAYLIELIVKIFRLMDKPIYTNPRNRKLVEEALLYMKENYNADLKLEEMSLKSFISKNYFSRLFKEVTGTSFSEYIQKLRVDEACRLLTNTDMKVVDIALQVGFKDLKGFYDVFKKNTGVTPGHFRKS